MVTTAHPIDVRWLRKSPRCRTRGSAVQVTFALEASLIDGPSCMEWSAEGLHATTPRIDGSSVTCCVPRTLFEHGAVMRVQVIDLADGESPIFEWTQIPALHEATFRARIVAGRPTLGPRVPQTPSRLALTVFD